MIHLLLLVLGTLAWLAAVGTAWGGAAPAWEAAQGGGTLVLALAGGFVSGVTFPAAFKAVLPGAAEFLLAFDHESAHAIAAVLTGGRVETMSVSASGAGRVRHAGSKANWFVALAPYFIPTATLGLLVVALVMPGRVDPWMAGALGATLGWHLASDWMDAGPHQPDIQDHGGWTAMYFVAGAWAFLLVAVPLGVILGPVELWHAASDGARSLWVTALAAWESLREAWLAAEARRPR